MSFPIKAVIFDWAGTMVDFGCMAPVNALHAVFTAAGVPISDAEARAPMGMAKIDHVRAMLAEPALAARWRAATGAAPGEAEVRRLYAALEPAMAAAAAGAAALIPGAAEAVAELRRLGVKIGSGTGYTRAMMAPILPEAARQGYAPEVVICAGETPSGRPSPLPAWAALVALDAWPAGACVKVDDAPVGIAEGKNAGCWAVGVAGSGNAVGLPIEAYRALDAATRAAHLARAEAELRAAGADYVIEDVSHLLPVVHRIAAKIGGA